MLDRKPRPPPVPEAPRGEWLEDRFAGLPARVLLPADYRPDRFRYPLVVFLHGSRERGDDNRAQLKLGVEGFNSPPVRAHFPAIVVAPQAPASATWGGVWYGGSNPTQQAVVALTRELAQRSSVDAQRLYLVGVSMGAIGGWEILTREPALYAAAVMVCGDLDPAWAPALAPQAIWSFHGADDSVVTNTADRALAVEVHRLGGVAKYTELPSVGHDAWTPVFNDPAMYSWLFAQAKPG